MKRLIVVLAAMMVPIGAGQADGAIVFAEPDAVPVNTNLNAAFPNLTLFRDYGGAALIPAFFQETVPNSRLLRGGWSSDMRRAMGQGKVHRIHYSGQAVRGCGWILLSL